MPKCLKIYKKTKPFLYTCVRGFSEQLPTDFSLLQLPEGFWNTSKFQPFLTSLPPLYMHKFKPRSRVKHMCTYLVQETRQKYLFAMIVFFFQYIQIYFLVIFAPYSFPLSQQLGCYLIMLVDILTSCSVCLNPSNSTCLIYLLTSWPWRAIAIFPFAIHASFCFTEPCEWRL